MDMDLRNVFSRFRVEKLLSATTTSDRQCGEYLQDFKKLGEEVAGGLPLDKLSI